MHSQLNWSTMAQLKEFKQAAVDFTLIRSTSPLPSKGLKSHVSDISTSLQLEFEPLLQKITATELPLLFRIGYCSQNGVPVAVVNLPAPLVAYLTCYAVYTVRAEDGNISK